MTAIPKYPKYKDSGVEWLGEVPEHWEILRAKHLFANVSEKGFPNEPLLSATQDEGVVPRDSREQRVVMPIGQLESFKLVREDDFVISLRSFQGGIEHSRYRGLVSPAYTVLRQKRGLNAHYLRHLLKASNFISELNISVTGIRQGKNIDFGAFAESFLPIPPSSEQDRIAAFLDEKTAQIDTLIAKKRRQIALLDEQKAILINRAVTRGLTPNAELKDSGIEWIGRIPKGWEVKSAKHACERIIDCRNRTAEVVPNGEFYVLRTTNVKKGELIREEITRTNLKNFTLWTERGAPRQGDVLFTREAPAGEACVFDGSLPACLGQRMMYFRTDTSQLLPQFLVHTIYSGPSATYIQLKTNGSTVGHLRLPDVYALPILLPPLVEQKRILSQLALTEETQRNLAKSTRSQIQTLQTLRSTLIAHAVTGKIKV